MPIDRRQFLRVSGALAVLAALPAATASSSDAELQPPGTYQISGRVRLHEPVVSISGISNAQQISWSPGSLSTPVVTFSSFEHFDQPWRMPPIQVTGGQLEAVRVVPLAFT
jgi:TAT (twin-arginine translocation) pathway signal sequence